MTVEVLLAIGVFRYVRTTQQKAAFLPEWDKRFLIGMYIAIGLLVIELTIPVSGPIIKWLVHALFFTLIYYIFTTKELTSLRSVMYAIMPFIAVMFLSEIVNLVNSKFFNQWGDYFDTAQIFAIVWMIAIWAMTKKQRKALEIERQKAAEKEKQYVLTESLKAELEIQVAERTAALTHQKEELQQTVIELKSTQAQLVQSEKMASLGELTAGIAHEIQNPLNFVNNFSEVNTELITEMKEALAKGDLSEAIALADDITSNEQKINHHGKRADAIVKGMLQHSRSSSGLKEPTDINALADEYLRLAYHGLRAKDKSFNATMKTDFDKNISKIKVIPQDMGRVILNLITNAFYAVADKKKHLQLAGSSFSYEPTVTVATGKAGNRVRICVKDNGNGIPAPVLDKIFQPFFTTKPTGEGTGLGLSMSYDIVTKGHGGELKVETKEQEGSAFTVYLPL